MSDFMAVDVSKAPRHIKEELEATTTVNSPEDFNRLTQEARGWIEANSVTCNLAEGMTVMIGGASNDFTIAIKLLTEGIDKLHLVIGKDKADHILTDVYNKCAEFIRDYNIYEAEEKDAQAATEKE